MRLHNISVLRIKLQNMSSKPVTVYESYKDKNLILTIETPTLVSDLTHSSKE